MVLDVTQFSPPQNEKKKNIHRVQLYVGIQACGHVSNCQQVVKGRSAKSVFLFKMQKGWQVKGLPSSLTALHNQTILLTLIHTYLRYNTEFLSILSHVRATTAGAWIGNGIY